MSENGSERRLPPPAFPPGSRRHSIHTAVPLTSDDAYIEPDAPMPGKIESSEGLGEALISPDEPIPERRIELVEEFQDQMAFDPDEEGVVVGMDLEPNLDPTEVISGGDPYLIEVIETIDRMAESLRKKGESGLRVRADMPRFEATLRAYCVGYLVGRRVEEPPPPILDEALPTDG